MARKSTLIAGSTSRRESVDTALKAVEANFIELYQAQIAAPVVTVGNTPVTPNGVALISVQLKNLNGDNLSVRTPVKLFFSGTSYGAPTDLGTVGAPTAGTVVSSSDTFVEGITNTSGVLALPYTMAANGNIFVHAQAGGKVAVGNAAITGVA